MNTKYRYFISYAFKNGFGNCFIMCDYLLNNHENLEKCVKSIAKNNEGQVPSSNLIILNFMLIEESKKSFDEIYDNFNKEIKNFEILFNDRIINFIGKYDHEVFSLGEKISSNFLSQFSNKQFKNDFGYYSYNTSNQILSFLEYGENDLSKIIKIPLNYFSMNDEEIIEDIKSKIGKNVI